MKEMMPFLIACGMFLGGLIPAYFLGRVGVWKSVLVIACLLLGSFVWFILQARSAADGWDGIANTILAVLFVLPSFLGVLAGSGIAYVRHWRTGPK